MPRHRLLLAAALVLAAGLALRFAPFLPAGLRDSAGGICYVVLGALLLRLAGLRPGMAGAGALGWSCLVEALQAWPQPELEALRHTLPGRLVLGTTFEWSDFPPYFIGAALAGPVLRWTEGRQSAASARSTDRSPRKSPPSSGRPRP